MSNTNTEALMDDDGENQAVRCFLQLYGGGNTIAVHKMREHLTESGFDGCWPEWADEKNFVSMAHITKSGAQDWLRHLFALESALSPPAVAEDGVSFCGGMQTITYVSPQMEYDFDDTPPSVAVNVQESEREYPIPPETVMPRGEAYGDVLDMLYAAWHREAPGDTFAAIGAAIQEIQALRALPPAVQVPPGWKLVPIVPTSNMVVDGFEAVSEFRDTEEYEEMSGCQRSAESARICWKTMLDAAPSPTSQGGENG